MIRNKLFLFCIWQFSTGAQEVPDNVKRTPYNPLFLLMVTGEQYSQLCRIVYILLDL